MVIATDTALQEDELHSFNVTKNVNNYTVATCLNTNSTWTYYAINCRPENRVPRIHHSSSTFGLCAYHDITIGACHSSHLPLPQPRNHNHIYHSLNMPVEMRSAMSNINPPLL